MGGFSLVLLSKYKIYRHNINLRKLLYVSFLNQLLLGYQHYQVVIIYKDLTLRD